MLMGFGSLEAQLEGAPVHILNFLWVAYMEKLTTVEGCWVVSKL